MTTNLAKSDVEENNNVMSSQATLVDSISEPDNINNFPRITRRHSPNV